MTKTPDLVSSKNSPNNQLLKPALIAALANLDIKLEEELPRYRRERRKELAQIGRVITPAQGQQPDLIYISASGGRTNPSQPAELPPPPISLESKTPTEANSPTALPVVPTQPQLPTGLTVSNGSQTIAEKDNPAEKYLESSEQLIKTLGEDSPKQPHRKTSESLLSPLGIGSMLLFLMASITFGYVISKPANFANLGAGKPTNKPNATPTTPATPVATVAPLPTSPNLAAREFVEVNLDTLSNLSPKTTPPPTPKPTAQTTPVPVTIPNVPLGSITPTTATPAPSNNLNKLSETLLPPAKQPKPAPSKPAATGTPIPTPTVTLTPKPSSNSEDYYYVVTDYTGPLSLEKALQFVGDAYTREFSSGTVIQLGAFNDAETAKVVVTELQRQGLSAKVYRP
ncbi:hypothetical protein NG798_03190 [Ancylothrix sp. C2]|uniref:hypothetical protein n=1 Tax=Ancylothrix sp. D3o TaxID=2953691 RepID=UPI0021BAC269|nr:hypothetical protein [Ancylothrix sp. D3o]MCT7948784.1 hypothetical protein [Ancylothrix sp. D3o]